MLHMAWQNIRRRKGRTILVVLGIMQAIGMFLIMSALMLFFERDMEKQVTGFANVVIVQTPSDDKLRFPPTDSVIRDDQAEQLIGIEGTVPEASSAILFQTIVPSPAPGMPPVLAAVGVQPGREQAFLGAVKGPLQGQQQLAGPDEALIGVGAAEELGGGKATPKQVGDAITIKGHTFKVAGVMPKTNMLVDGAVVVPLPTLQRIIDRPGTVTAVMLTAKNGLEPVVKAVKAKVPALQPVTPTDLSKDFKDLLAATQTFFQSVRMTVLVVAVIVIMTVMMMAIHERRRDIGTLRALGASPLVIVRVVMYEAVLLSLLSGLAGTAAAAGLASIIFDNTKVDLGLALQSILASVAVGALASLLPSYLAARVNPIESLRYE